MLRRSKICCCHCVGGFIFTPLLCSVLGVKLTSSPACNTAQSRSGSPYRSSPAAPGRAIALLPHWCFLRHRAVREPDHHAKVSMSTSHARCLIDAPGRRASASPASPCLAAQPESLLVEVVNPAPGRQHRRIRPAQTVYPSSILVARPSTRTPRQSVRFVV